MASLFGTQAHIVGLGFQKVTPQTVPMALPWTASQGLNCSIHELAYDTTVPAEKGQAIPALHSFSDCVISLRSVLGQTPAGFGLGQFIYFLPVLPHVQLFISRPVVVHDSMSRHPSQQLLLPLAAAGCPPSRSRLHSSQYFQSTDQ